ncbi:PEGA domain-containing protein [Deinococcus radiophilus]|uniref:PEGA domain-containing protein n=1 Tax=Deinococcus radiophilus TaxID=32062 RepID=UPI003612FD18
MTDTAFFDVAERTPVRTGSLFVGTNVNNASVVLNGRTLGAANQTFSGIAPGTYPIKVRAGSQEFRSTVRIQQNMTTNLDVNFRTQATSPAPVTPAPVASTYNVTVRSNLNGGRVFMNGNEVGTIRNGQLTTSVQRGQYQIVIVAPNQAAEIATITVNRDGGVNLSQAPRTTTINLLDLLFR